MNSLGTRMVLCGEGYKIDIKISVAEGMEEMAKRIEDAITKTLDPFEFEEGDNDTSGWSRRT